MIAIVLLMQSFFLLTAYYIIGMNEDSQIQTYSVDLKLNNFGMDSYFGYGLWSRYSPLGSVLQVGQFGVLDSDCFHLHNAAQQSTNDLNLIVYDCLNYETKTIIRRIQFVTIDENWHLFEVELDELEYEYVWHYFEITQWPQRNRFELLVIKYPEIKLYSIQEDFQFPYKDTELLLTFGGGLQISQSNTNQLLKQLSQFSFFPGKFYLYPLSIGTMPITRNAANTALSTFQFRANCLCNYNSQVGIQDQELTWLDKIIFPSQKSNCDSYLLSTWIKIQNIFQSSPEFLYQVLKLSANFENPTLVNNNLAAFQLLYKITSSKNSLIVNTYSYTFPLVSINFDNDPFLIPKEFDLQHNINLWHYVLVILSNNELKIQIIFYEGLQQHHYNYELAVNQFRIVKFKLFYGNVKQLVYDYLSVKFVNTYFFNCAGFIILPQLECHESCLECDGPTNTDCLSCPINSNRIYIPEQKSCVCPYNTVEEIQCKDYQNYNFILVKEDNIDYKCLQGYFQYEGSCIKCPSVIRSTSIACLECVYQAQTWATNSFCSTTLYDDIQGGVAQFQQAKSQQYYIFDGDALQLRYYSNSKIIDEETNDDFTLTSMNFKNFCFQHQTAVAQWRSEKECYQCTIQNCQSCAITALAITCLSCDYYSKLKDGICIPTSLTGQIVINDCLAPFYYTSTYQCKICNIQNCKYCFEYLSNDLTKCTLYRDFESFKIDEYHQVGCALCNDDFIYDFTSGKCKHEKPNIDKCLRSYINLQGQEICTLSKIDDFKIAPEIINCQTYISNCKQCLMTPQNVIRCILCEDGYTTSITTGQCYQCLIQNARICIEGDYLLKDQWMQLIQSFLIQFLPNKYMYPKSSIERYTIELPQECQQGFRPDPYSNCIKYCDSNCLQCVLNEAYPYKFYCNKCPLDYYKKPLKSSEDGKCFQCPQLCSVCQSRTEEEIKMTNPYYILNEGTIIYTLKCLQQAPDDNVVIDPYTNIARYCYKSTCTDVIQYQFDVNCQNLQNLLSKTQMQFYQNNININYCNKLGIKKIVLYMTLLIQSGNPCNLPNLIEIYNDLRKKIYALQEVQLKLEGLGRSGCFRPIVIINFSIVEIINVAFEVRNSSYLKLENNQSPINLIINNSIIFGNLGETQQYSITLSKCGDLIIQDLQIINLNLLNSTILDYISLNQKSKIFIKNLSIFSSIFNNSILFAFSNLEQSISITNILIQDCQFYNSLIFSFNSKSPNQLSFIEIQNLKLVQSRMISSSLIITYDEISVNFDDIYIYKNQFNNSTLLGVSQNLVLQNTILVENIFMKSLFLFITEIEGQSRTILIDHLNVISNAFETSSIINTKLYISNAFTKCQIINLYMQNNHQLVDSGLHLFNLNIYSLTINGCLINYSINLNHFKLTEILQVQILSFFRCLFFIFFINYQLIIL